MAGSAAMPVIVDDNSDDEAGPTLHSTCLPVPTPTAWNGVVKPPGMDDSSWKLIQMIVKNEEAIVHPPRNIQIGSVQSNRDLELAWRLQQEEILRRDSLENQRKSLEENDRAVAANLCDQEEERRRIQEQEHMAMALQIQFADERRCQGGLTKPFLKRDEVLGALKSCQLNAVNFVKDKAKKNHEQALYLVQQRVESLGFTKEDLSTCLNYIRDDAPIIIHLNEATLSLLNKDTHYRSLFETKTSGGKNDLPSRMSWEESMFGTSYSGEDSTPFDRPKYGCLNVSGDIQGVPTARRYGELFLILHQHVRYRTTFFNKDTAAFVPTASLATNDFYAHVLQGYNDTELIQVLNVCNTARLSGARSHCST